MALHDDIRIEIEAGNVPEKFRVSDLMYNPIAGPGDMFRLGEGSYALNYLKTEPANKCPNGYHVRVLGQTPRYERAERGLYRLIGPSARKKSKVRNRTKKTSGKRGEQISPKKTRVPKRRSLSESKIYDDFVSYLEAKPFRMYVGSGVWYPDEPQVGWKNRLKFYAWTSGGKELAPNWGETNSLIKNFSKELRPLIERIESDEPVSAESLKDIYEKIKEWGNPRGAERSGAQVLAALKKVVSHANGGAAPPVDSTLTKVYAMAWPDEYAIYDTRVAASIVTIAEDLYRRTRLKGFCERFPALGHMDTASISGTRPRGRRLEKNSPEDLVFGGWPNAYKKWPAQLDANRLCLGIQKVLNKRRIGGRTAWSLREVEAVLFMEGY